MPSERSILLADLLSSESPDRLRELAALLNEGRILPGFKRARLERAIRGSQESLGKIAALLSHWDGEDKTSSAEVLADVLEAAAGRDGAGLDR